MILTSQRAAIADATALHVLATETSAQALPFLGMVTSRSHSPSQRILDAPDGTKAGQRGAALIKVAVKYLVS